MKTQINFVNEKPKNGLFKITIPLIIAMILNMSYNLVDSLWIGNLLGENAMAALTSSTPIILILTSIGMGASGGVAILLSQAVGAKDHAKTKRILSTSLIGTVILCIVLILICESSINWILTLLHTPSEIFSMAKEYLAVYLLGFLPVFLYLYFTAVLRSYGNTLFQILAILFSTVLNIILEPIFIHILGFSGAAIATILSQSIALLFMAGYILKKKLFHFSFLLFDWAELRILLCKSFPSIIQQSIPPLSTSVLTSLVSSFGVSSIAAYGVTGKLEIILFYPAMALNMALTTIVGQCIGAKRPDLIRSYLKTALLWGCGLLLVLSALVVAFAGKLSHLFLNSNDIAAIVGTYFLIVSIGYILYTITSCYMGAINGLGKPGVGMYLMIFYYIIIRMPLAYLLSHTSFALSGIWLAILISHVVAAVSAAILFNFLFLKLKKV
ncbi:MATE family efflux transporter [Anaerocolumna sp. AGMB13025]|uniref:MATE family efflux transporter n=1 Tax=Anaerocolumna sp. AGMB13025 TaxID=3039116 RepID=UPI00241C718B|nr:MATE family efflux transporter [Anaerocolumna sp. AGMB13025]WFR55766.1 MATE family efflux transporter [Anaerocolumna sp. AGMB13025]